MINDSETYKFLFKAVNKPESFTKGDPRRQLQATYDRFISELSLVILMEECEGRMQFRQRLNKLDTSGKSIKELELIESVRLMLKHERLLFSKDYTDHFDNIKKFLVEYLKPTLNQNNE